MYQEEIGMSSYTRLEIKEQNELVGKRITSPREHKGKIRGITNAKGEHHPCIIHIEGGEDITPDDLVFIEFDGRHGFIDV